MKLTRVNSLSVPSADDFLALFLLSRILQQFVNPAIIYINQQYPQTSIRLIIIYGIT